MRDRELDELIDLPPLPPLPADCLKQIEAAVIADLKPVRPLAPPGVYFAAFAGIFIAICALSCYCIAGQSGWDALGHLQRILVFIPLLAIASLLVFSIVRQMTPAARATRSTAIFGAGLFVLLVAVITIVFHPIHESAFVRDGLGCFRIGILFAIPTAFLLALLLRRGSGLSPPLTGATAGGLAGLAGLTVLEIHCPNLDLFHIIAWHISVVLLSAIAGLMVLGVAFRRRISSH